MNQMVSPELDDWLLVSFEESLLEPESSDPLEPLESDWPSLLPSA